MYLKRFAYKLFCTQHITHDCIAYSVLDTQSYCTQHIATCVCPHDRDAHMTTYMHIVHMIIVNKFQILCDKSGTSLRAVT